MKRTELNKRLRRIAWDEKASWEFVRHGGNHDVWAMNGQSIPIPRHAEINELTALGIIRIADAAAKGAE